MPAWEIANQSAKRKGIYPRLRNIPREYTPGYATGTNAFLFYRERTLKLFQTVVVIVFFTFKSYSIKKMIESDKKKCNNRIIYN